LFRAGAVSLRSVPSWYIRPPISLYGKKAATNVSGGKSGVSLTLLTRVAERGEASARFSATSDTLCSTHIVPDSQ
jgi:hypothetical protein